MASPEGFQIRRLSCDDSKGTGELRKPARIDSKERRYAYAPPPGQ